MRLVSMRAVTVAFSAAFVLFSVAGLASGTPLLYTLDSNQSSLTITGTITVVNQSFSPQAAGSNVAHYSGTVVANRSGSNFTLTGGSNAVASNSIASAQPGGTPANYGLKTSGLATGNAAVRNLTADFTSGPLGLDGTGHFDSTGITVTTPTGIVDYAMSVLLVGSVNGSQDVSGDSEDNSSATASSVSVSGAIETLQVPVSMTLTIPTGIGSINVNATLTGTLLATRVLGDFNGDHVINNLDYTTFKSEFGHTGDLDADLNYDGVVNLYDFTLFRNYYKLTGGTGASFSDFATPVPEPSSVALALGALPLVGLLLGARRRRKAA